MTMLTPDGSEEVILMPSEVMWRAIAGETRRGKCVTHIVPMLDMFAHYLDAECWCSPELDDTTALHHSADGRELFSMGLRKVS